MRQVLSLLIAGSLAACATVQPADPNVVSYNCKNTGEAFGHPYRIVELNQFNETMMVWNPKAPRVKIPYNYSTSGGGFFTAGWVFYNGSGKLNNITFGDNYACSRK